MSKHPFHYFLCKAIKRRHMKFKIIRWQFKLYNILYFICQESISSVINRDLGWRRKLQPRWEENPEEIFSSNNDLIVPLPAQALALSHKYFLLLDVKWLDLRADSVWRCFLFWPIDCYPRYYKVLFCVKVILYDSQEASKTQSQFHGN